MTADDVREARQVLVDARSRYVDIELAERISHNPASRFDAALARREQEAEQRGYQRGQADGWDEGFIKWLVDVLHYPFDMSFQVPPPVDHDRLADYWNESDNWAIPAQAARECVREAAGL